MSIRSSRKIWAQTSFCAQFRKPVVDALPFSESVGKIAPLDAGLCAKDDSVDEQPVTVCRLTSLRARRQQRLQSGPLLVGQRVPLQGQL
jgi:hypothetical protein